MDTHQQYLNKIQSWLLYGLILLLPLTHKESFSQFHPDLVWSKFILAICAGWGFIIFSKNYKFYIKNIYFKLLSVYLAFQLLSLFRSEDLTNSLLFIGFYASIVFLFVYIYDYTLKNKDAFKNILKFYLISFIGVILFLARQIYLQENFQKATGGVWPVPGYPTRYGSTFWDVNHFGIYLVTFFLLILGYLFSKYKINNHKTSVFGQLNPLRARLLALVLKVKGLVPQVSLNKVDKKSVIFLTFILITILVAFKLTGSRSSLLGFLAGIGFFITGYIFLHKKLTIIFKDYRALTFLSVLSITPILLLLGFKEDFRDAFLYRSISFYAHLFLLKVGILTGLENFFLGIGVNAFSEYFKTSVWADSYYYIDRAALNLKLPVHNLWLEAWVETGVFSFIMFALLWAIVIYDLYKIYKANKDYLSLGFAAGIIAFLVGGMFYSYKSEFFWFYACIAFVYASIHKEETLKLDLHIFRSYKLWLSLVSVIALIFPVLFFTMPPGFVEIYNFYYFVPDNKLFQIWAFLLDSFRYVIGNYSFTGRFLMTLLYFASIFSCLSVLRKFNLSFFTSLLMTVFVFLVINLKYPAVVVSFTVFNIYLLIILTNLVLILLPIKRRLACEIKAWNYMLAIAILIIFPFSVIKSMSFYENTYDTNLNFLIELAANRSKTNDAVIFIENEDWAPLVRYYADRLEDDEEGKFYMIDSYLMDLKAFNCNQWNFEPGVKYLYLVSSTYECPTLTEGMPNVSVVKQEDYKLIMYEQKIRR